MDDTYSDEQLRLAARLYYVDGKGQVEISRFMKVSQAKVSRLLALARERGIVQISVAEYESRNQVLEKQLCERFGLRWAAVIKTVDGLSRENVRRTVAHFGAPVVAGVLEGKRYVAIAGGRTMRELIDHLPEMRGSQTTVVQAMGSIDAAVGPLDALELGRVLSRKLGSSYFTLNTPAFVPDKQTQDMFLGLDQIRTVWKCFAEVDLALVGIGDLQDSVFVERNVLTQEALKALTEQVGVVGEICGRFFDKKGRECRSEWHDRVISIELDRLRKVPEVIGVVAGGARSEAIAAAVRGRIVKSLLIDDAGAETLLESLEKKAPASARKRR